MFFLSYQFWALIIRSAGKQDFLDKGLLPVLYFLLVVLQIKGNDEEEYTFPLTRESGCMYALEYEYYPKVIGGLLSEVC